ncbi:ribosome small subunit-dependent GTPase A [Chlorobium sp. N1]|uniref:ribosome small subunit-dependent GTPase A n=1 Tax=Chlorobium sp. N1 TaxID=2491138 RepID=UPI00103E2765|nr:ribosome small subunit-dependent GTPase A [Chlorobium sp. N1]TCD47923.1 ribosome small subunit-dependent GTPase A [Chlorobium sp. N1]
MGHPKIQGSGAAVLSPCMVVEAAGAFYMAEAPDGTLYRSRTVPLTKSHNEGSSLVAVGDMVLLRPSPGEGGVAEAVITEVLRRQSVLSRRRDPRRNRSREKVQVIAANIDQLVVVSSAFDPPPSLRLIDRYLAFAESEQLEPLLIVNKSDLDPKGEAVAAMELYGELGYRVLHLSAKKGIGIEPLLQALEGRVSAFSGHSGVGKSSLINRIQVEKRLQTSRTSSKSGKGVHTTSRAVMLRLPGGGHAIDTPGIREFSLSGISRENLRFFFREFLPLMPSCSFSSCSHTVEPGCAVRRAAEEGLVHPSRYESYLALYEGLEDGD